MPNKSNQPILLLHPPGWSVNYGAPHLALPIIKGYLNERGIDCNVKDLNIEVANFYNLHITKSDIEYFVINGFDEKNADNLYYNYVKAFNKIGKRYDGDWKIKSGFNFNKCNLAISEDIRTFSKKKSPFTEYYHKYLIPYVKKTNPLIIGFSITVPSQLLSSFEIVRLLRKSGFAEIIVFGGNTITRIENNLKKEWIFKLIDFVITNQGEEALELLYHHISSNNKDFSNVPNLLWLNNKSEYIKTTYKRLPQNKFSMPVFDDYPIGKYWGYNYLPIIGARGCYYGKCSFCAIPYAWGNNGFVGYDDTLKLVDFVEKSVKKYNINKFSFVEEAMNVKKLKEFSLEIIKRKLNIKYEGYARFDKVWSYETLLSIFKEAGLKKLFIGMEFITDGREGMNKGDNVSEIMKYFKLFKKYGIKLHLFTMFGFPGTKIDDALRTIEFLLENKEYIDTIDVSHFVYARHTKVNGVVPIINSNEDWALEYKYYDPNGINLNTDEAKFLANSLESLVLSEQPQWLHPIYRMYSTWKD